MSHELSEQQIDELLRRREAGQSLTSLALGPEELAEAEALSSLIDELAAVRAEMPVPEAGLTRALEAATVTAAEPARYAVQESFSPPFASFFSTMASRWKALVPIAAMVPVIAVAILLRQRPATPIALLPVDSIVAFADTLVADADIEDEAVADELSDIDLFSVEDLNAFANASYDSSF